VTFPTPYPAEPKLLATPAALLEMEPTVSPSDSEGRGEEAHGGYFRLGSGANSNQAAERMLGLPQ
jgi:hypothetical protein